MEYMESTVVCDEDDVQRCYPVSLVSTHPSTLTNSPLHTAFNCNMSEDLTPAEATTTLSSAFDLDAGLPPANKPRHYVYCVVPQCKNTSSSAPGKRYFWVPKDPKQRKKWMIAIRKSANPIGPVTNAFCCEDHFDLEEDTENYLRCKLVGGKLRLKKGVLPHKFECQNRYPKKPERSLIAKLKAKSRAEEVAQILANASQEVEEIYVVDPVVATQSENIEVDPLTLTEENSNNDTVKLPTKRHQKIQVKLKNKVSHKSTQTEDNHVKKITRSKKSQTILELCSKCEMLSIN